jgi:hypothetical protein
MLNNFITVATVVALSAAILSSIAWVGLSYTWWRMERKRAKNNKNSSI